MARQLTSRIIIYFCDSENIRTIMRKNKSIALYTLVAIVAIFLLIILYSLSCYLWPAAPSKLKEGVVLVEAKSRYSIAVGKDTLYVGIIGMNRDIETRSHYRGDSAEVTSFASGFFVANDGGLITSASLWNGRPAIVQGKTLKDYLEK